MSDFVLDKDPFIPTGDPATPDDVVDMLADPESPVTLATIDLISEWQRPSMDQIMGIPDPADLVEEEVVGEPL